MRALFALLLVFLSIGLVLPGGLAQDTGDGQTDEGSTADSGSGEESDTVDGDSGDDSGDPDRPFIRRRDRTRITTTNGTDANETGTFNTRSERILQHLQILREAQRAKFEGLSDDDLDALGELEPDQIRKLAGLTRERIAEIAKRLPRLDAARKRFLEARENYLAVKARLLQSRDNYLNARQRFRNLRIRCQGIDDENKPLACSNVKDHAINALKKRIMSAMARLEVAKEQGTAPDNVDALLEQLQDMLDRLSVEEVTGEEVKAVAQEFRGLWAQHKAANLLRVISNMLQKLDRLSEKMEEKLDSASAVIDRIEAAGAPPEFVERLRNRLAAFQGDLDTFQAKYDEAKADWLNTDNPPEDSREVAAIAKRANRFAKIFRKKLQAHVHFLRFLARAHHRAVNKGETDGLGADDVPEVKDTADAQQEVDQEEEEEDAELQEAGAEEDEVEEEEQDDYTEDTTSYDSASEGTGEESEGEGTTEEESTESTEGESTDDTNSESDANEGGGTKEDTNTEGGDSA